MSQSHEKYSIPDRSYLIQKVVFCVRYSRSGFTGVPFCTARLYKTTHMLNSTLCAYFCVCLGPLFGHFFGQFKDLGPLLIFMEIPCIMGTQMATDKQLKYAEQRARGLSRESSALLAGYSENNNMTELERSTPVVQEVARIKALTAQNTGVTKEEVVEMLKSAAELARLQADPMGMVSAARELGKMLGFYAPEIKKTLRGIDKNDLKRLLADMPDEELLKLANAKVIEGTAERVDDKKV